MIKIIGLFFLMFGVVMAVFMATKISKIDHDSYLRAVISDKFIDAIRHR